MDEEDECSQVEVTVVLLWMRMMSVHAMHGFCFLYTRMISVHAMDPFIYYPISILAHVAKILSIN